VAPGCTVTAGGICFASLENACRSLNCAPNPCVERAGGEVRCAERGVPGAAILQGAH
jgi:hypothetical protein